MNLFLLAACGNFLSYSSCGLFLLQSWAKWGVCVLWHEQTVVFCNGFLLRYQQTKISPFFPLHAQPKGKALFSMQDLAKSLVWTSKPPCVRGSHLSRRLLFIVTDSDLLCCHEMSLLLSVLGFVNSSDVYPHLFEVFLVKPPVRAKFCLLWLHSPRRLGSVLVAEVVLWVEQGLQKAWFAFWVCPDKTFFLLLSQAPVGVGKTWNEISALLKQVRVHTNEQYPRTLKQI